jgi:integrase/recombinase XerD
MIKTNSSGEFGTRPRGSARAKLCVEPPDELNRWVDDFDRHLSRVVGLAATTRHQYCFYVRRFLAELRVAASPDRSVLRAEVFTTFVRQEAGRLHGHSRNQPGTAMRAWLRYLFFAEW